MTRVQVRTVWVRIWSIDAWRRRITAISEMDEAPVHTARGAQRPSLPHKITLNLIAHALSSRDI